jgi:hypothetical protein
MDRPDALRVLAEGHRSQPVALAAAMILGLALVLIGLVWAVTAILS